jgi:hypothetical protein
MIKSFIILVLVASVLQLHAQVLAPEMSEDRKAYLQAVEYYKKEQFESSLALLQKLKTDQTLTTSIYYLIGLNYYRIEDYVQAEKYLAEVTRLNDIKDISSAYYYLGLSQFYKNDFEKAVNSFELSIDTSIDPEHDKKVERIIEKSMQLQNQLEADRLKFTFGYTLGYTYDSNTLNVAEVEPDTFDGSVLSASAFFSHKTYQDKETSIEPLIYISDSRTWDYKLIQTEEIQAADSTLILTSVPYKTVYQGYRSTTSFNLGLYMLPSDEQNRDLSITIIYLKQNLGTKLSQQFDLEGQLVIGRDQSQLDFTSAEDNQSAIKYDLSAALKYSLNSRTAKNITAELGFILNDADGDNASYNKFYANLSYDWVMGRSIYGVFKLSYGNTDYNLSELERKDDFSSASLGLAKDLSERTTMTGFVATSRNDSTIDDYVYDDISAGLQYVYLTKF